MGVKVYTKTGDAGDTSLYGGKRVPKDDLRIQVYGTLDELNALLGVALTKDGMPWMTKTALARIQGELFQLGAELATPLAEGETLRRSIVMASVQVEQLESEMDAMDAELTPLCTFIVPGGTTLAALLHVARTVSRRAERELITLNRSEPVRPVVLQYLNRISDYLFVSARYINLKAHVADKPWVSQ